MIIIYYIFLSLNEIKILKQILFLIIFITASVISLFVNRQGVGIIATSPKASQKITSAIISFSDDMNIISAVLIIFETKTNTTIITAIATNRFSIKTDKNSYRQVLFRFTRDTRNNTNQVIIIFIPDVLNGF
jgi:hypothetical protein